MKAGAPSKVPIDSFTATGMPTALAACIAAASFAAQASAAGPALR